MEEVIFTYVVATTLTYDGFEEQIANICKSPFIDRVIILNNSGKAYSPTDFNKPLYENRNKILVVSSSKGTSFKNSAWNVGIWYAKPVCSHLILATEYLSFDASVINLVAEQITDLDNLGMLGIDSEILTKNESELNYIYTSEINECESSYGELLFIPRKNYLQIPSGIMIYFGAEFLFKRLKERGLSNYSLKSDTFRINNLAPAYTDLERLRISLDKKYWAENFTKTSKLILS
jgi:hypothetical protein